MNRKLHVYGGIARYKIPEKTETYGNQRLPWLVLHEHSMTFDAIEATTAKNAARAMLSLVKLTEANAFSVTIEITHRDGAPYTGFQPKRWSA